ncbi:DUF1996 domain-containing protein [Amycolatopsis orientalis]|nr:DUF1996 domain-containing protein [Amycolatopsis orientalis]
MGTRRFDCGRNAEGVRNSDNLITRPGVAGGAHHLHDYVGNMASNAFATEQSLTIAPTTCQDNDRSSYYWPVLRVPGDHGHQDPEAVLTPSSVLVQYRGNLTTAVVAMPPFLRIVVGNPQAYTQPGKTIASANWTCSGSRERTTTLYPRCPAGQQVVRVFDFPSCWNGTAVDSANHRAHVVYPMATGACPANTLAVPQLHLEVAYDIPVDANYVIDTFREEQGSSSSDHADFINVMPDALMAEVVRCLNEGLNC